MLFFDWKRWSNDSVIWSVARLCIHQEKTRREEESGIDTFHFTLGVRSYARQKICLSRITKQAWQLFSLFSGTVHVIVNWILHYGLLWQLNLFYVFKSYKWTYQGGRQIILCIFSGQFPRNVRQAACVSDTIIFLWCDSIYNSIARFLP